MALKGATLTKPQAFWSLTINAPAVELQQLREVANLLVAGEPLAGRRFLSQGDRRGGMAGEVVIVLILEDLPRSLERFGVIHKGEEQVAVHGNGARGPDCLIAQEPLPGLTQGRRPAKSGRIHTPSRCPGNGFALVQRQALAGSVEDGKLQGEMGPVALRRERVQILTDAPRPCW